MGTPSQATGRHLPYGITCHPTQVNVRRLTPAKQAGTRFTYPGGMEGWVDLVDLIASMPEVEPATFRSRVRHWIAAPPRQPRVSVYAWLMSIHHRLCLTHLFAKSAIACGTDAKENADFCHTLSILLMWNHVDFIGSKTLIIMLASWSC